MPLRDNPIHTLVSRHIGRHHTVAQRSPARRRQGNRQHRHPQVTQRQHSLWHMQTHSTRYRTRSTSTGP